MPTRQSLSEGGPEDCNYLIMLAVVLVAVIIGVAIFRGDPILTAPVCPGADGGRDSCRDATVLS